MLFQLWVAFSLFAFGTFLMGYLLGFPGIASIGAVLVMLTGGQVILEDIQVADGQQIERNYTTVDNTTVENQTTINSTYQNHSWTQTFTSDNAIGIGVFQVLIGVLLFFNEFDKLSRE